MAESDKNGVVSPASDGSVASIAFETAASHASRSVPVAAPQDTAGAVRASLIGANFECVSHIAVLENARFTGLLRVETLMNAPADAVVSALMDRDPPVVSPGVDQELASWKALKHGEAALAVVGVDGAFHGVIPPQKLLAVLLAEHEEDLSHLGGFLQSSAVARQNSIESVARRFKHRLPWLLVGLGGAFFTAGIVGGFEEKLKAHVMLAFFIPAVVYLADAVGTQTETVVIRGLSLGVRLRSILLREILTGLAIGAVLALLSWPLLYLIWGAADVALGVSLSLFAACSTATLAAISVPWALTKFGVDPAFGSGPLATVIQDILSIAIYLAVVTVVVN